MSANGLTSKNCIQFSRILNLRPINHLDPESTKHGSKELTLWAGDSHEIYPPHWRLIICNYLGWGIGADGDLGTRPSSVSAWQGNFLPVGAFLRRLTVWNNLLSDGRETCWSVLTVLTWTVRWKHLARAGLFDCRIFKNIDYQFPSTHFWVLKSNHQPTNQSKWQMIHSNSILNFILHWRRTNLKLRNNQGSMIANHLLSYHQVLKNVSKWRKLLIY